MTPPSSRRIVILGGRGYLGGHFQSVYPEAAAPQVDIADAGAVARTLDQFQPAVVINCAGKTGRPNVDWCESHKRETLRGNVTGPLIVLEECLKREVFLVHLSSGCIYSGDNGGRGFSEDDPPNFAGSFYSRTKAWADQALRDFPVLTLRIRMPFEGSLSDRNLLVKLRKYSRVLDDPNSLTHVPDFLNVARVLIERRATGVYNVVNEGVMSPYEVMVRYRELVDPAHRFERLSPNQLGEVVRAGRSNCRLSTDKLRKAGLHLPDVREAVDVALRRLAGALRAF
jgi:dTDP-4-dehydrorhamnose reductase